MAYITNVYLVIHMLEALLTQFDNHSQAGTKGSGTFYTFFISTTYVGRYHTNVHRKNSYAFIDAQNTHQGIKSLGWQLDWKRFRIYLKEKYAVTKAYVFIGYLPQLEALYEKLRQSGYILVFKPVIYDFAGRPKGNCDADMVLQAVLDQDKYDKAVIVTSDGDFYSLVRHLYKNNKLKMVLSSHADTCSKLLKREANEKISYMNNMKQKIGAKNKKAQHKDETL
jgi:uncharacterized LabA/DUF88 family protein